MPVVNRKSTWGIKTHIRSFLSLSQALDAHKLSGLITCLLYGTVEPREAPKHCCLWQNCCRTWEFLWPFPRRAAVLLLAYSSFRFWNIKMQLQKMLWFFIVLYRWIGQAADFCYLLTGFLLSQFLSSRPSQLSALQHSSRARNAGCEQHLLLSSAPQSGLSTSSLPPALPCSVSKTYKLLFKKPAVEI